MNDPIKWTDIWQARASVFTAAFTAASVVLVFIYTALTNKALRVAKKTTSESLRPVVILLRVGKTPTHRFVTFSNAGEGVAISLAFFTGAGEPIQIASNVLAPGRELVVEFLSNDDEGVINVAYESIEGRVFRTISSYSGLDRVFNKYLADGRQVSADDLKRFCGDMLKRAQISDAHAYLAQADTPPME